MPTGSSKLTEAYSAPSYANAAPPSPMRYGDDSTTVIGNTGRYNTSPITHNSAVSHPPHSFDEVRQPYISKPDGANFS